MKDHSTSEDDDTQNLIEKNNKEFPVPTVEELEERGELNQEDSSKELQGV